MKSGDMVYYRLTEKNAELINWRLGKNGVTGKKVEAGQIFPALVITAFSTFDRVPIEEIHDSSWARKTFSGVADLKVFLPGSADLWVSEAELDESPVPAPQELQISSSLLVYPAHGKFTTVQLPPLI